MDQTPPVAVIMPVLNEEQHLAESVAAITGQDYPGELQIALALGPSTDATDEVARRLQADDPRILLVPNPTGKTPAGLNAALAATTHPIVVRVDGHALLPQDYISTAVEALQRTGADNVGGVMAAEGVTDFERAVACAMRSPLGVGAASFHTGGQEGPALTVYLGRVPPGGARAGRRVRRGLRAGPGLGDEPPHPGSRGPGLVHPRYGGDLPAALDREGPGQAVPALRPVAPRDHAATSADGQPALSGAPGGRGRPRVRAAATAAVGGLAGWRHAWLGLVPVLGYAGAITLGGWAIGAGEPAGVRARVPVTLATMHLSWGVGFLTSPGDLRP